MNVEAFMERGLLSSDDEAAPKSRKATKRKHKMTGVEQKSKKKKKAALPSKPVEDSDEEFPEDSDAEEDMKLGDDFDMDEDGDDDDSDVEQDEGVDDAEDSEDDEKMGEAETPTGRIVSQGMVKGWTSLLQKHSLKGLRQVVDALGAAIHRTTEVASAEKYHYFVENPQVFNALVRCCLRNVHLVVQHHIPAAEDAADSEKKSSKKKKSPTSHANWSRLRKVVKSYVSTLLLMLQHLHQPTLTCAVLRQVQHLLVYISCFPRLLRLLTKRLTSLWSSGDEFVRVLAFMCLRRLVITNNNVTYRENCFKQMYLSFARNSAFTSVATLPGIRFMENSLTEIYAIDAALTYQHGFVYIRQLAVQLRKAMTEKTKANLQSVYNWQFVHSLCLWCRVLGDCFCPTLEPLVFPLVQVVIGTVQLLPTARYFPLRFHCLRALVRMSTKTDVYIPVSSHLLEVLDSATLHSRTKGSMTKPPNFAVILKISKSLLLTRAYQDGLIDNVFDLLLDHLSSYSHHIAFPELVLPTIIKVKQFAKKTKVPKFQQLMQHLIAKVDETSTAIVADRSTVAFSPKDTAEVASWMTLRRQQGSPLHKFYTSWKKETKT